MTLAADRDDCAQYPAPPGERHLLLVRSQAQSAAILVSVRCADCGAEHVIRFTTPELLATSIEGDL